MDGEARIRQRYFRKVSAPPEGAVVHHGDCDFFSVSICTCGLLADLRAESLPSVEEIFSEYYAQLAAHDATRNGLLVQRSCMPRRKKPRGG